MGRDVAKMDDSAWRSFGLLKLVMAEATQHKGSKRTCLAFLAGGMVLI
jgi:hypothetical protein